MLKRPDDPTAVKSVPEEIDSLSRKIVAAKGEDYLKTFLKSQGAKSSFALLVPLSLEVDRIERVTGTIAVAERSGRVEHVESRDAQLARLRTELEAEQDPVKSYELAKAIGELRDMKDCPGALAYARSFTSEEACAKALMTETDPERVRALVRQVQTLRWGSPIES